jgi:VanZ family protein
VNLQSPKLRRLCQVVLGAYWLLIFTLTHIPPSHLPHVNLWDKLEHLLAYGALGGLLFLTLWFTRPTLSQIGILTLAIGMMYGAVDEWLQIPVHRDCDLIDWFSDTTGLAIAVVCMTAIRWRLTRDLKPQSATSEL